MQVLHVIRRKRPSARPTKQHPAFKMQLQQKVDRVEAGVGMQENRHRIQRMQRLICMTVWRYQQDIER